MPQLTASDGARIAYGDEGHGRPLVLLHGLMAHGGFFERQRPLRERFRLIVVDLRGHGRSPSPGGRSTIERMAEDVGELCGALDLRDALGIGWSMGATILWKVLVGPEADRFAGAVVIDMTPRVLNGDGWTLGLSPEACEARTHAIAEDFGTFAAAAAENIVAQPLGPRERELARWAGQEFGRNDPKSIAGIWASLVDQDQRDTLQRIGHPTLIVHGERSALYGAATAAHIEAALPDARTVAFPGAGHAPHLEQPDLFNRTISDFAAALPGSAAIAGKALNRRKS